MIVHIWVVAGSHKLDCRRDVWVAAGEAQGQLVFESFVSLKERRKTLEDAAINESVVLLRTVLFPPVTVPSQLKMLSPSGKADTD